MNQTPRVAGYGIVRNAEILSYPFYDAFYQCFSSVDEFHVFYDTGSDDRTAALATRFAEVMSRYFPVEAHPFRVDWKDQTAISAAQNAGAAFLLARGHELVLLNQADEFLPEGMRETLRAHVAAGRQVGFEVIHTWGDRHVITRANYTRLYRAATRFTGDGANVCGTEVTDFVMHGEAIHHLGALFHPETKYAAHSKLYGSEDQAFIAANAGDLDKVKAGFRRLIGAEFEPLDFPLRSREAAVVGYARQHRSYPFELALEAIEADLQARRTAELRGRTAAPVVTGGRELSPPSVIIPCFNCLATLPDTLDSVYRQGLGPAAEIVCVDDASTDGTGAFLEAAARQLPGLRLVRHEQNRGGAAARNTAVRAARGGLLFCLDSDNLLHPGSLLPLKAHLEGTGAEAAAFAELRYFEGSPPAYTSSWHLAASSGRYGLAEVLAGPRSPPASGNYLYSRRSWERAGGYPEGRGALDAWGFGLRQVATGTTIEVLPGSFYWHRVSDGSYWMREHQAGRTVRDTAALLREVAPHLDAPSRALVLGPEADLRALDWLERGVLRVAEAPLARPASPGVASGAGAPPRPPPTSPADLIRPGDLVFDVGAHGGKKAREYLSQGARVVSFEPQPHRFAELSAGLRGTPGFEAVGAALTDREGTIDLWICDGYDEISTTSDTFRGRSRHAKDSTWNRRVAVPCTTLDRAIERHGVPDFCKIDVEGAEAQVLAGLSRPVALVSVEFHLELVDELEACLRRLEQIGYRRFNVALYVEPRFAASRWLGAAELLAALRASPPGELPWGDVYALWDGPVPVAAPAPARADRVEVTLRQAPREVATPAAAPPAAPPAAVAPADPVREAERSLAALERAPEDEPAFQALVAALAALPGQRAGGFWRALFGRLGQLPSRLRPGGPVDVTLQAGARVLCGLLEHGPAFERAWQALGDEASRRLMLDLIALRVLGDARAGVEFDQQAYLEGEAWLARACRVPAELPPELRRVPLAVASWSLALLDLTPAGLPARVYTVPHYAAAALQLRQYQLRRGGLQVGVQPGDVVIDGGACFGETALHFAHEAGAAGRVVAFEFLPSNLQVLRANLALNPALAPRVQVVEAGLHHASGTSWGIEYDGPAARLGPPRPGGPVVPARALDDVVEALGLPRVDFIKLDVEGAEPEVLRGAERTLRRFRPRLAIAAYHEPHHVATLADQVDRLGLGYRLHLDHFTDTWGETVLFARPGAAQG